MTAPTQRRAVLYLRLSQETEASTSIVRQRADLTALAEREGWAIVAELVDDGVSGRKSRAKADEALRIIRDREADVLAVAKLDRWSRQGLGALAALIDTLDSRPDALFVAHADGLRSSSPAWRIIAGVLAEVARLEADNTSARVRSARAHLREARRFTGYAVPFGYLSVPAPDGRGRVLVPDPVEAPIVRELAERVLQGATLTELTTDLQRRQVATTKSPARKARQTSRPTEGLESGLWHLTVVRSLLLSPTLLGRTTVAGPDGSRVPLSDAEGLPVTMWPPLIEPATAALLRERLPVARGKLSRRRAARVLSGVAFCAVCDSKLYVVRSGSHVYYRCAAKLPYLDPPCPAPQLIAERLEAYVEERLLGALGSAPEVEEVRVVTNPEAESDLADIDRALHEATAALMSDGVDAAAIIGRITSLKARRAELRDRPAAVHVSLVPTGRTLGEAWHAADPAAPEGARARRALVLHAIDHVTLAPGASRAAPVADRVAILWADFDPRAGTETRAGGLSSRNHSG